MSNIVSAMTPLNVLEEKEKFLVDETYNPQFRYGREFTPEELTAWGMPQPRFYEHAQHFFRMYQRPPEREFLTETEVRAKIAELNTTLRLDPPLEVLFSPHLSSHCQIEPAQSMIRFRAPIPYTTETFGNLIRHEVETHLLRYLNHQQQTWAAEYVDNVDVIRTEEGLASLHSLLFASRKYMFKTYRTYIATVLAQQYSFTEMYHQLRALGLSESTAWSACVRAKRGITDTGQPGGNTKDVCYFEGMIAVWKWLQAPQHDPHDLYFGRIAIADVETLKKTARTDDLRYPSFFHNMNEYLEKIGEIAEVNKFTELL